ncbi:MAG: response regulator transcription factor [Eubacteriales bacterium]|nr:response regulator transcription factor [Eubacteriales bacterium]
MEDSRILIVDDNPEIREVVTILLEGEGFVTEEAGDGSAALDFIRKNSYDLILLDVMMPGLNGYQTCVEIRKTTNAPILFLSARTQVEDKTMGFLSGGDDYLPKPFSYQELLGRVKALVRRYQIYQGKPAEEKKQILKSGKVELDEESGLVKVDGKEISLTDTEFAILCLLLKHRKQIFSVERLYEAIWEEDYYYGASNIVMVHIRNLRAKIEEDPHNPQIIRTVWGRGYRCE